MTNNKNIKKKIKSKNLEATKKYQTKSISETKKTNYRKPSPSKEKDKNLWIVWLVICVFILVLSAFKLGILITVFVGIVMVFITGIAYLLKNAKTKSKKRKIINGILIACLSLFIIGLLAFGAFLVYITVTAPKFDPQKLNTKELSILYDKDGIERAKLGSEKREKVSYDELPEVLVDAIVATEDSRFFTHNGFDAPRFIKATLGQLLGHSDAGGASTLSMQVIKNSITSSEATGIKGIIRKFTDIYLAVFKLEKNYTKEQIIEFYANNHSLGGNIYGVEEASQAYFNKSVSELNLSEAAIIAGMFKAPNYYKPTSYPENAEARRRTVLYLMEKHGYITEEQRKEANAISVESLIDKSSAATSDNKYQSYIDTVVDELDNKYNINPYTTSVEIYTNLDVSKQESVDDVMNGKTYTWKDDQIQSGVSVLDSETGKILAIGAGRNRKIGDYNYATQGKRQPGSTAKPLFDYGPGIEYNNWSTYTPFVDEKYSYSNGRSISNWDNSYMGTLTLRRALSLSRNIPALKAFQQVDNKKIIEFVQSLGITPEVENGRIHEAHSIGAFTGVNPLQMSAAYAAFSNGGYYNEPYSVEKIVYRETGETIKHKSTKKKVMSDSTAYMISSVLQDVSLTGGSIKNVAAKTGTTNFDDAYIKNNGLPSDAIRDSWVVGYTTKTVIGMWYGYNKNSKEYCLRNIPATIAKDKLFKALAAGAFESNKAEFKMPDSVVKLPIISGSNPAKVAPSGYTGAVVYELFKKGYEPDSSSSATEETALSKPGNLKGTYANNKITLTWDAVSGTANDSYGELGYNIYLGDTLLTFTTGTSYTYDTKDKTGNLTFKVIATYKSYSGLASEGTSTTVKIETTPTTNPIKYTVNYLCGSKIIYSEEKTASSTTTTISLNASQIIDIIPSEKDQTTTCSSSRNMTLTKPSFTIKNGDIIEIYYTEETPVVPTP